MTITSTITRVSEDAISYAQEVGIADTPEELIRLAEQSTPFRHTDFNRRYEDTLFSIHDGEITDIWYVDCTFCNDTGKILFIEECDACSGKGCPLCNGKGTIRIFRNCTSCTNQLPTTPY